MPNPYQNAQAGHARAIFTTCMENLSRSHQRQAIGLSDSCVHHYEVQTNYLPMHQLLDTNCSRMRREQGFVRRASDIFLNSRPTQSLYFTTQNSRDQGVIHQDIKGANILTAEEGLNQSSSLSDANRH